MTADRIGPLRFVLPLPRLAFHPLTAVAIAAVHLYLAAGHLAELAAGNIEWTHLWKGLGALCGAYVFAAVASRAASARRLRFASSQNMAPAADGHPPGAGCG